LPPPGNRGGEWREGGVSAPPYAP